MGSWFVPGEGAVHYAVVRWYCIVVERQVLGVGMLGVGMVEIDVGKVAAVALVVVDDTKAVQVGKIEILHVHILTMLHVQNHVLLVPYLY